MSKRFKSTSNISSKKTISPIIPPLSYPNKFDENYIKEIYNTQILSEDKRHLILLENNSYLENYLWPHLPQKSSSFPHIMSIIFLINEKYREQSHNYSWDFLLTNKQKFSSFLLSFIQTLSNNSKITIKEKTSSTIFLIHLFSSFEYPEIQKFSLKLLSISIWTHINESQLSVYFTDYPELKKKWGNYKKNRLLSKNKEEEELFSSFFPRIINDYFNILDGIKDEDEKEKIDYCERFIELLIDLLSSMKTRLYIMIYITSIHFYVKTKLSKFYSSLDKVKGNRSVFVLLVGELNDYLQTKIDDEYGEALSPTEIMTSHYMDLQILQRIAFKYFKNDLHKLSLEVVSKLDNPKILRGYINQMSNTSLFELCKKLKIFSQDLNDSSLFIKDREIWVETLCRNYQNPKINIDVINNLPLYPTEKMLWDKNIIPSEYYDGSISLALPKLNLSFLSINDYLLRNFKLFRLLSTFEIREDIHKAIIYIKPCYRLNVDNGEKNTIFSGHSRMASPIDNFNVTKIGNSKLGESKPGYVTAEITLDLGIFKNERNKNRVFDEWDDLRQHDILFLCNVIGLNEENSTKFVNTKKSYHLKTLRGCEIKHIMDETDEIITERDSMGKEKIPKGTKRTYCVYLDSCQYEKDAILMSKNNRSIGEDVYKSFNLVIRRRAKENNFKAVLETIRDLINNDNNEHIPEWLHHTLLGYGDPESTSYYSLSESYKYDINLQDTFLNISHIKETYKNRKLIFDKKFDINYPYEIVFDKKEIKLLKENNKSVLRDLPIEIKSLKKSKNKIKRNNFIKFTPTQIEAIKSSMLPGMSLIVGPPGTGKTDCAVQIINNLYYNNPNERTLIITHSNNALNDIFEKISQRNINEKHLLRLGYGYKKLETDSDFSRHGRLICMLNFRQKLLKDFTRLCKSLGLGDCSGITCETACHHFFYHIVSRWEEFLFNLNKKENSTIEFIENHFPFKRYFEETKGKLFEFKSFQENLEKTKEYYKDLEKLNQSLKECIPFEILRTYSDRGDYLITTYSKIIAMTCTYAALKRGDLIKLRFSFDNLIMEEAAQILEIETFIPLLLQKRDNELGDRLKRVILIGDHYQLPPIIKNIAFQKFSRFDQSMFSRFVRLGIPTITLNKQGRAREDLSALFSWRYKNLENLPLVYKNEYLKANTGLLHTFQLINVENYNDQGETAPIPYFYQNLGEAEYIVQLYMYMRLLGYPSEKITILTTYNGQKSLIQDIINARCDFNEFYGRPFKVTTVDKYQGKQNDFILLSLVRTKSIGHIRDIRRLIVALSRARLGLYVFCRVRLFAKCYELTPSFDILLSRPTKLGIVKGELYPCRRNVKANVGRKNVRFFGDLIGFGKFVSGLAKEVSKKRKKQEISQQECIGEPNENEEVNKIKNKEVNNNKMIS